LRPARATPMGPALYWRTISFRMLRIFAETTDCNPQIFWR